MTTISKIRFLARHAEVLRVRTLPYDERPLSREGVGQAQFLARFCALVRSPQIVTSSLSRSIKTAEVIASTTNCGIIVDSRLNELTRQDDAAAISDAVALLYELWPPFTLFISHGGTLTAALNRLLPIPLAVRDRHGSVLEPGGLIALTLPESRS